MTPLLDARQLSLQGRLNSLDLASIGGELVALVGPNGAGKTSLLRALARVEDSTGEVRIDGENLDGLGEARRCRLLSFLPASREVAWPIAVRDIIALGVNSMALQRVDELMDALDLRNFADRPIGSLSTGERARALLARALAPRPRLLLLDEPLSNLDPYWVLRTIDLLTEQARAGATVMVSLHDLALVDRFDRLILLDHCKIVADGRPEALMDRLGTLFGIAPAQGGGWRIDRA
ncbi:MAG: ATP-binding cassette domain-containing protein [Sphingomicrobium sp.]